MSETSTREVMTRYIDADHRDVSMLAPDAVFQDMNSGQEHRGPEAILGMLDYIYHRAFDARPENGTLLVGDGRAVAEATFVGKHIGEFAGIPATGRDVRVPLCVSYDLEDDRIVRARIYLAAGAMLEQLTREPATEAAGDLEAMMMPPPNAADRLDA